MNNELQQLKKQIAMMKIALFSSLLMMGMFIISSYKSRQEVFDIIRAKGIIIEDASGKDRILIGAPVPPSKDRVRTDTARVRKLWASRFPNPDQYMEWYKNYSHSAIGMVVLNEDGHDKVALGEKLPDPNTGKRMFENSGFTWNDDDGFERGGAGVNKSKDGKFRSVVGLDDDGGEAVHLVALEDGTKGLIIGGETGRLLLGMSKKDGQWFQNKAPFAGAKFFDTKGAVQWQQQMNQNADSARR